MAFGPEGRKTLLRGEEWHRNSGGIDMNGKALPDADTQGVSKTVFVHNELGLHARPAAKLAQAAQQYQSRITLEYDDMVADAKSILDILSLAAGRGASLTLRCSGEDAGKAAENIEALFGGEM